MKKAMALLLACSMVLAFAACSKKQYTEQEVTAVVDVTDENGKTVTDKDGKAQTRVVTIPQTDAKGNTVAAGESAADGKSAGNGGSAAKDMAQDISIRSDLWHCYWRSCSLYGRWADFLYRQRAKTRLF